MEKRHKITLTRTLTWTTRIFLVGALFIPFILTMEYRPQPETIANSPTSIPVPVAQKPPPRELMKIYSIVSSHRPDITESEAWEISEVIMEESSSYGLDPMLVLAVIDVESKFQYGAVSPAGARGIMQILPYVAQSLVQKIGGHQLAHARSF